MLSQSLERWNDEIGVHMTKQENKSVGTILKVFCLTCKNSTKHKVLTSVDISDYEGSCEDDYFGWNNTFQIIECQGCSDISFRKEYSDSNYIDADDCSTEYIYPERTEFDWNTKEFFEVPSNLRRIYNETINCFNNKNLTLCGAGIRALVEGLCKENKVNDGMVSSKNPDGTIKEKRKSNLEGKINGLHEKNILTTKNANILHKHRFLGNYAVHELEPPTKKELGLALEIIENVFEHLYELPEKSNQLGRILARKMGAIK